MGVNAVEGKGCGDSLGDFGLNRHLDDLGNIEDMFAGGYEGCIICFWPIINETFLSFTIFLNDLDTFSLTQTSNVIVFP